MQSTRHYLQILTKLDFSRQIFEKMLKYQISVETELFTCGRTNGQIDSLTESNSRFSQFCERTWKLVNNGADN
jgi:hypothetical protein